MILEYGLTNRTNKLYKFFLYSLVNKYLCKKGKKIYVAFVGFKKALDSVNRSRLFFALRQIGIKGNLLNLLLVFTKLFKPVLGMALILHVRLIVQLD